jgi:hypothetical protein
MRRAEFTVTPIIDDDGLAAAQSVSAAGFLTLDGALIADGKWSTTGQGFQVAITSAGDDTGVTFTVYGLDVDGKIVSGSVTGGSASAATISTYFREVTAIEASTASAATVTAGFLGGAATPTYVLNYKMPTFMASLAVDVTGTIDGTVQHTFDNVFESTWTADSGVWRSHDDTDMVGFTASQNSNYAFPPVACRTIINSASDGGSVTFTVIVPA